MSQNPNMDFYNIYLNELLLWNKKVNLTSITDEKDIWQKHFEDSLTVSKAFNFSIGTPSVIDVGSGAGFPGIPLKIKYPNIHLTLLDSSKKKTDFLKHIVEILKLENVGIIWSRAEDFAKEKREYFDTAVSRAVSDLRVLAELCLPYVKIGGKFIAMKAKNVEEEVKQAENAIKILGGTLEKIIDVSSQNMDRNLIVISKINSTPLKYPRKAGIPQKRPI